MVWVLIMSFGCLEPVLALLGYCPFWCLGVCLALMANSSFLIKVSQQPLGFMLHLELGNTDTALPTARWLRRNEPDKKVSLAHVPAVCCSTCAPAVCWIPCFPSTRMALWGGSASLAAAAWQDRWSSTWQHGKKWERFGGGRNHFGPITSVHRKGAGTGHWCLGKFWEGRGEWWGLCQRFDIDSWTSLMLISRDSSHQSCSNCLSPPQLLLPFPKPCVCCPARWQTAPCQSTVVCHGSPSCSLVVCRVSSSHP